MSNPKVITVTSPNGVTIRLPTDSAAAKAYGSDPEMIAACVDAMHTLLRAPIAGRFDAAAAITVSIVKDTARAGQPVSVCRVIETLHQVAHRTEDQVAQMRAEADAQAKRS